MDQEDDNNIVELFQNLLINNLRPIILKCSRLCLHVTFTLYTNVHNTVVSIVRKGKKKAI